MKVSPSDRFPEHTHTHNISKHTMSSNSNSSLDQGPGPEHGEASGYDFVDTDGYNCPSDDEDDFNPPTKRARRDGTTYGYTNVPASGEVRDSG